MQQTSRPVGVEEGIAIKSSPATRSLWLAAEATGQSIAAVVTSILDQERIANLDRFWRIPPNALITAPNGGVGFDRVRDPNSGLWVRFNW